MLKIKYQGLVYPATIDESFSFYILDMGGWDLPISIGDEEDPVPPFPFEEEEGEADWLLEEDEMSWEEYVSFHLGDE
jgi:hypothetical protein